MTRIDEILALLSSGPHSSIDPQIAQSLGELVGADAATQKARLREILDWCVRYGLASDNVVAAMDFVWREWLGGTPQDPTPWRETMV